MPRRSRYQIPIEILCDTCPLCRELVHPAKSMWLNGSEKLCPHCSGVYVPQVKGKACASVGFLQAGNKDWT